MMNGAKGVPLFILMGALCFMLPGCDIQFDEHMLEGEANYSIDIALPYATVTPLPAQREEAQALVIDASGCVTVNDSARVLSGESEAAQGESSNYKSLRQGNTGLAVQALQTRLQALGYLTGDATGVYDSETEAAVRRFEQTYGTMQTGVATADLQGRLFASDAPQYGSDAYNAAVVAQYRVLQRGDVGSSVYSLQQRLKNLGYPISELTGIFDNETANAVMLFYEAYGLTASEVANVALQKEIYSDGARTYGDNSLETSASTSLNILSEETVQQIQQRLIDLGYLTGAADGQLNRRTEIAVRLLEEASGQLSSGALNEDILTLLSAETVPSFDLFAARYVNLIEGSGGDDVLRLQNRLVALGFAKGTPNGEYNAATSAAVKLFQAANGLEETGVASIHTQAVLFSSFALNVDRETVISAMPADELPDEALPSEVNASDALSPEDDSADGDAPRDASGAPLSAGSTGDAVLRMQNRLTELGYITSVTGIFDNVTGRAVSAFETAIGREADGIASDTLLDMLYSNVAPRNGDRLHDDAQSYRALAPDDRGDDVTALQKRLWELNYLDKNSIRGSVGIYNEATAQFVAEFQAAIGYENPDGLASVELQCYLFSEYSDSMEKP